MILRNLVFSSLCYCSSIIFFFWKVFISNIRGNSSTLLITVYIYENGKIYGELQALFWLSNISWASSSFSCLNNRNWYFVSENQEWIPIVEYRKNYIVLLLITYNFLIKIFHNVRSINDSSISNQSISDIILIKNIRY